MNVKVNSVQFCFRINLVQKLIRKWYALQKVLLHNRRIKVVQQSLTSMLENDMTFFEGSKQLCHLKISFKILDLIILEFNSYVYSRLLTGAKHKL